MKIQLYNSYDVPSVDPAQEMPLAIVARPGVVLKGNCLEGPHGEQNIEQANWLPLTGLVQAFFEDICTFKLEHVLT